MTQLKIYSNCDTVSFLVGETEIVTVNSNKIFYFPSIPLVMGEGADNWFVEKSDGTVGFFQFPEGYFYINDTIEDIMSTEEGTNLMMYIISQTAVQGNQKELLDYPKGYIVKALIKLASGKNRTPETLLMLNEILNKVAKSK